MINFSVALEKFHAWAMIIIKVIPVLVIQDLKEICAKAVKAITQELLVICVQNARIKQLIQ